MPDTFQTRLRGLLGPRGYEDCMRRSVQTVILYEAFRCVESKLGSLRPFQRKLAFFDQAVALLDSLDFISPHQRETVLWRTNTSREVLEADVAWKRQKAIDKDLVKYSKQIEEKNLMEGRTHQETCDLLVEELFRATLVNPDQTESEAAKISKDMPKNWEHSHNNTILCYRLYYNGTEKDPNFPPPVPATEIVVPAEKPKLLGKADPTHYISLPVGPPGNSEDAIGLRRKRLSEIREHMETLDKFQGLVPDDDIIERKRELFFALPPIPPYSNKAAANKKAKK